jgi:hypothetical protein
MAQRAVLGSQLTLQLFPCVHLGQSQHPGQGTGWEELGGHQVLGSRLNDVGQMEVGGNLVDPWWKGVSRQEKGRGLATLYLRE